MFFRQIVRGMALVALTASTALAQTPPSHQVNADGTVTFRFSAKGAEAVSVSLDALPTPLPMTRDDAGQWTATTSVLPPQIYSYTFKVDGTTVVDAANPDLRFNLLSPSSNLLVPATPPAPWELAAVPHGRLDHHEYTSAVVRHYPANQAGYVVYTPPGYDANRKGGYPVLYLLHGFSDAEYGWTNAGHADDMLDAMIASGQIVPMIVVMPVGYGDLDFVLHGFSSWKDPATVDSNTALFSQALLTEVMPAVEREYRVAHGRQNRAITGLSMGGRESLDIGLRHPELFAYVGGFSSAVQDESFDTTFAAADAKKAGLKLLWVACGSGDALLQPNVQFINWARARGYDVTAIQTPGRHTWMVWRDNLLHFAPLLFRGAQ